VLGAVVETALRALGVKVKVAPPPPSLVTGEEDMMAVDGEDDDERASAEDEKVRMRVGGLDVRREPFKGWVEIESFRRGEWAGSFAVMRREAVRAYCLVVPVQRGCCYCKLTAFV
jgi:serine/threonine-protein kinase Chk1